MAEQHAPFRDAARPRGHDEVLLQRGQHDVAREVPGGPHAQDHQGEQRQGEVPEQVEGPGNPRGDGIGLQPAGEGKTRDP